MLVYKTDGWDFAAATLLSKRGEACCNIGTHRRPELASSWHYPCANRPLHSLLPRQSAPQSAELRRGLAAATIAHYREPPALVRCNPRGSCILAIASDAAMACPCNDSTATKQSKRHHENMIVSRIHYVKAETSDGRCLGAATSRLFNKISNVGLRDPRRIATIFHPISSIQRAL